MLYGFPFPNRAPTHWAPTRHGSGCTVCMCVYAFGAIVIFIFPSSRRKRVSLENGEALHNCTPAETHSNNVHFQQIKALHQNYRQGVCVCLCAAAIISVSLSSSVLFRYFILQLLVKWRANAIASRFGEQGTAPKIGFASLFLVNHGCEDLLCKNTKLVTNW